MSESIDRSNHHARPNAARSQAAGVRNLDTVLDRAEHQKLIDFAELHSLLKRHPRRPGTRSLAGYRVLRFTYEQITKRPTWVIASILAALGAL